MPRRKRIKHRLGPASQPHTKEQKDQDPKSLHSRLSNLRANDILPRLILCNFILLVAGGLMESTRSTDRSKLPSAPEIIPKLQLLGFFSFIFNIGLVLFLMHQNRLKTIKQNQSTPPSSTITSPKNIPADKLRKMERQKRKRQGRQERKESEEKERQAKESEEKERQAKGREAIERQAKESEAKERQEKGREEKERQAKEKTLRSVIGLFSQTEQRPVKFSAEQAAGSYACITQSLAPFWQPDLHQYCIPIDLDSLWDPSSKQYHIGTSEDECFTFNLKLSGSQAESQSYHGQYTRSDIDFIIQINTDKKTIDKETKTLTSHFSRCFRSHDKIQTSLIGIGSCSGRLIKIDPMPADILVTTTQLHEQYGPPKITIPIFNGRLAREHTSTTLTWHNTDGEIAEPSNMLEWAMQIKSYLKKIARLTKLQSRTSGHQTKPALQQARQKLIMATEKQLKLRVQELLQWIDKTATKKLEKTPQKQKIRIYIELLKAFILELNRKVNNEDQRDILEKMPQYLYEQLGDDTLECLHKNINSSTRDNARSPSP